MEMTTAYKEGARPAHGGNSPCRISGAEGCCADPCRQRRFGGGLVRGCERSAEAQPSAAAGCIARAEARWHQERSST